MQQLTSCTQWVFTLFYDREGSFLSIVETAALEPIHLIRLINYFWSLVIRSCDAVHFIHFHFELIYSYFHKSIFFFLRQHVRRRPWLIGCHSWPLTSACSWWIFRPEVRTEFSQSSTGRTFCWCQVPTVSFISPFFCTDNIDSISCKPLQYPRRYRFVLLSSSENMNRKDS